jgi:hypothetical protein
MYLPDDPLGFGPQYEKDNKFKARMRFHQSWYRSKKLKVPYGTGPKPTSSKYYGNMLAQADGDLGKNFINDHIFEVAKERVSEKKGTLDEFRLYHNMLSSQPMSFNLFGQLVGNGELSTRLMQVLFPGEIKRVTKVLFEFAPEPRNDYLNDRTAFDVLIEYHDSSGLHAFLGIETKLADIFSQKAYKSEFYDRWLKYPAAPWPASSMPGLQTKQVNQLWRNHLLAFSMTALGKLSYTSARFVLVYHPEDKKCVETIEAYKKLLKPEDQTFITFSLDHIIDLWRNLVTRDKDRKWINDFHIRYLKLEDSEVDYLAYVDSKKRRNHG